MTEVTPCLWFDDRIDEAVDFYLSVFPRSRLLERTEYGSEGPGEKGSTMVVMFELDGKPFMALNGGPTYQFTPAVSFMVTCKDQAEVDYYWGKFIDGGQAVQCGWLSDRFGLSWQIVPERLLQLHRDPDPAVTGRVMRAMLQMVKLDVATIERAAAGD